MRSSRLVLAALTATTIGVGLFSYQQNVVASAATVAVSGTLHIIHGDPKPGSSQAVRTRYSLAGESGEWSLEISDAVLTAAGGVRALNRKRHHAAMITGKVFALAGLWAIFVVLAVHLLQFPGSVPDFHRASGGGVLLDATPAFSSAGQLSPTHESSGY